MQNTGQFTGINENAARRTATQNEEEANKRAKEASMEQATKRKETNGESFKNPTGGRRKSKTRRSKRKTRKYK
jgi:hypothetical protein